MHLLAADVHERGASIKVRQIAHVDAPDRVKIAMPRRKPGRVQGMTDLSNGKRCSPKCATARDRSQSTYRAVGRTKGLSGHAARGKTPQEQQYPGSRSVCGFGRNSRLHSIFGAMQFLGTASRSATDAALSV